MKHFSTLIQKAFRSKGSDKLKNIEYTLADQIANYVPLLELQDKRQLLQVEVTGSRHSQSYQSMIVGVDFVKQKLLLDALGPENPYCPVIVGDKLQVTHQKQGQILSFSGELTDIIPDKESLIYLMELPSNIAYKQRRFYPRLSSSSPGFQAFSPTLQLKSPIKTPWHCSLKNISAGGICVSVPGNVSPLLQVGALLPRVKLQIGEFSICSELRVKSYRHHRKPYDQTSLSLSFSDISFQDRLRLQNLISFQLENGDERKMPMAS